MRKIGTINNTKEILEQNDFLMKKKYGQNFLVDQNILMAIVEKAKIDKKVNVIEIGPGIGSLTEHLLEYANHVISYEIDEKLIPILTKEFAEYDNFTLINQDILKANLKDDINKYFHNDYPIYLVANLPYYITTPIIMNLLFNIKEISKYVVMVQKEVADRFAAKKGTKDYNSLSIVISYKATVEKALFVSRNVFMPKPNVDSEVVIFNLKQEISHKPRNEEFFYSLVRNSFANRRKTLINNLNQAYKVDKGQLAQLLTSLQINENIRSEALELDDFIKLSDALEMIL